MSRVVARAIREGLGLSQQAFARAYKIPLATLKGWEQGPASLMRRRRLISA